MPPPTVLDLNYTTVYGQALVLDATSTPSPVYPGTITFTPSTVLRDTNGNAFFFPSHVFTANTDVNGNWTIDLPATDDPDINPVGWTYDVVESWSGGRRYSIAVPYNPPSGNRTVAFATIAPAPASSGIAQFGYLGAQGPQGFQGVVGTAGSTGPQGPQGATGASNLLKSTRYAPGTAATYTVTSATFVAMDSTNMNTGSFTAPASGQVWVEATLLILANTVGTGAGVSLALFDHGALTTQRGDTWYFDVNTPAGADPTTLKWLISGLTPGNSYNFDLAWAQAGSVTITARVGALTGAGSAGLPTNAVGPALFKVISA